MHVIDTNSLIVLILGLIDVNLFKTHKTVSIYDEDDFIDLTRFIGSIENLIVLPNVWAEVDNLLNGFSGSYKHLYIEKLVSAIKESTEEFVQTDIAIESDAFSSLGITDSLLLTISKKYDTLITADSKLSDYANACGILVYDMVKEKQIKLQKY